MKKVIVRYVTSLVVLSPLVLSAIDEENIFLISFAFRISLIRIHVTIGKKRHGRTWITAFSWVFQQDNTHSRHHWIKRNKQFGEEVVVFGERRNGDQLVGGYYYAFWVTITTGKKEVSWRSRPIFWLFGYCECSIWNYFLSNQMKNCESGTDYCSEDNDKDTKKRVSVDVHPCTSALCHHYCPYHSNW